MHIECKTNGKWEHYAAPNIDRWYKLFGLLAGVRDKDVKPISPPKGLPEDLSTITNLSRATWGREAHDYSWLDASEIATLSDTLKAWGIQDGCRLDYDLECSILHTYFFGNSFAAAVATDSVPGIEDIRFIFWFDN